MTCKFTFFFKMLKNFNISAHFIFDRIAEKYYENKVSGSGFKFFFCIKNAIMFVGLRKKT